VSEIGITKNSTGIEEKSADYVVRMALTVAIDWDIFYSHKYFYCTSIYSTGT
jgi:hypothetical protein